MSPMKWVLLNVLTQSSILQLISFLSMKKDYSSNQDHPMMLTNKMNWKW